MNNTALAVRTGDKQLEALRRIVEQETPKNEIRVRLGRGGMRLKYTDGAYVIRTLNAAFGWDWDFVADSEELLLNNGQPFEVKVRGTLTVRLSGQAVTKTQFGCQPIEMLKNGAAPVSIGDCYKGAATDALKKCASMLGIALDLYDSDYRADKYADEPEPGEPERPVKLEGAQPTDKPPVVWPNMAGMAGQIFGKCAALGWTPELLANEIYARFKMGVSDTDPVLALEALGGAQLKELDQALAGEFNNRRKR